MAQAVVRYDYATSEGRVRFKFSRSVHERNPKCEITREKTENQEGVN